jgi:PPOX class probable FMN-dependent enzyme
VPIAAPSPTVAGVDTAANTEITTIAELEAVVGTVLPAAADKVRAVLDPIDVQWIAHSPFCLLATSAADGTCDVSPKGDPAGFVHVLGDAALAMPERPGNRRVDGYRNVLSNPHVGLIFLVPGRGDTLRVNGRARLVRDAPYFDAMVVQGHRPVLALEVAVQEVFYHCSKAFLRSKLWRPRAGTPTRCPPGPGSPTPWNARTTRSTRSSVTTARPTRSGSTGADEVRRRDRERCAVSRRPTRAAPASPR